MTPGAVSSASAAQSRRSPIDAMRAGIGFVPEDRRQQGLVMDMSIDRNVSLASLGARCAPRPDLVGAVERRFATDWAGRLQLKYNKITNPVDVALGWQSAEGRARQVAEPRTARCSSSTSRRAASMSATKAEVHRLLVRARRRSGVAVLMISSELPEVLAVADRILVMREGRLVAELSHAEASEERIMAAATGQADVPARGGRGPRMSATAPTAEQGELASPRRLVDVVLRARTFGIIVVLGVVVLISALIQSRFVGGGEIRFILSQTSLYALVAVGEAMVILTRNVDLSVGSVVGLSAYVSANEFGAHPGISISSSSSLAWASAWPAAS